MAIFQVNLGKPVFSEANDDGGGGDNWTTGAISRAKLQSECHHQQTNTQFFYWPDALPVAQPTVSIVKALKGKYHIPWTCSPPAHLGSSNFVSDHKLLLVTLGEGCHASSAILVPSN